MFGGVIWWGSRSSDSARSQSRKNLIFFLNFGLKGYWGVGLVGIRLWNNGCAGAVVGWW